jgi:hypothetical protein
MKAACRAAGIAKPATPHTVHDPRHLLAVPARTHRVEAAGEPVEE